MKMPNNRGSMLDLSGPGWLRSRLSASELTYLQDFRNSLIRPAVLHWKVRVFSIWLLHSYPSRNSSQFWPPSLCFQFSSFPVQALRHPIESAG